MRLEEEGGKASNRTRKGAEACNGDDSHRKWFDDAKEDKGNGRKTIE